MRPVGDALRALPEAREPSERRLGALAAGAQEWGGLTEHWPPEDRVEGPDHTRPPRLLFLALRPLPAP